MIIGAYYLTEVVEDAPGAGRMFSSLDEAMMYYDHERSKDVALRIGTFLHGRVKIRLDGGRFPEAEFPTRLDENGKVVNPDSIVVRRYDDGRVLVDAPLGRVLFNEALPKDFPFVNRTIRKRDLTEIASRLVDSYSKVEVANSLDKLKHLGFQFASQSGVTISVADVTTPPEKKHILESFEADAEKVEKQFDRGIITDDERRQKEIEIWTEATDRVRDAMQANLAKTAFNPIEMMVGSGARGNVMQVRQIAGMRGLVANPKGEIIPRPIKSNFREGLSVLEYFISTHGARKGLADTA